MQKRFTFILNLLLCVCLLFTMIPVSAFASSTNDTTTETTKQTDSTTGDNSNNTVPEADNNSEATTPDTDDNTGVTTPEKDDNTGTTTPEPKPEPKPEPLKISGGMYQTRYTYLRWTADDANASYYIYRSTKKSSGFEKIATVSNKKGSVYFRNNKTKLTLGKTYYYKVKKIVNKKTVDTSNTVSIKISLLPVTNTKATITSNNDVKLSWTKSSYATSYSIYRCTTKNGEFKKLGATSKTTYTDKSPSSGRVYYYKIYAHKKNVSAAKSKSCDIIPAYTKTSKPTVTVKYTSKQIKLSWKKVTNAEYYYVYKQKADGKYTRIASTKSLSYTDKDVKANKGYRYRVCGVYKRNNRAIPGFYSS